MLTAAGQAGKREAGVSAGDLPVVISTSLLRLCEASRGFVESTRKLAIGEVTQLVGDDRALASEEQQLAAFRQCADFIRRQQRSASMVCGKAQAFGIERRAHGLE